MLSAVHRKQLLSVIVYALRATRVKHVGVSINYPHFTPNDVITFNL